MFKIVNEFPHDLILNAEEGPFISIYQPSERANFTNRQDLIRYKNALRKVENSLKMKYPKRDIKEIMKPLVDLGEDRLFWNSVHDGLGILLAEGELLVYNLKRPVKELVVVSDSFHIKPLIRNFQSADRYHLLGLSRKEFALYEGNRYGFEEIELPEDTPKTVEEALGDKYTDSHLTIGSAGRFGAGGGTPLYHGSGGKKDEIQIDIERFFRYVDRFVLNEYSNPTGLPLILVALDEYHGVFKEISHNKYLLDDGIKTNYESIKTQDLRETVWEKLEPLYLKETEKLIDRFEESRANDQGSEDLVQVARAAIGNRIDTLIIEADRVIPGRLNKENGEIEEGKLKDPEIDDVLDDIAEMVFKYQGEVIVLPKERMPSDTGVAATYRY